MRACGVIISAHGASVLNPSIIPSRADVTLCGKAVEMSYGAVHRAYGVFKPGVAANNVMSSS